MLLNYIDRIGSYLGSKLKYYPQFRDPLRKLWRRLREPILMIELDVRKRMINLNIDIEKVFLINLNKITPYMINPRKQHPEEKLRQSDVGKVIGGDWDLPEKLMKFENFKTYRAFYDRFVCGERWESTDYYKGIMKRISEGEDVRGCKTKAEFDERCKYLDFLYHSIKQEGYKSHDELSPADSWSGAVGWPTEEVGVSIGRDGQVIFTDGQHRLAIAMVLGLDKIPVKILVRHPEWVEFKKELLSYTGGKTYHPLTHIDLRDIPSLYSGERFDIIKENLSVDSGQLLDIGANLGYFCHKFEEEGFECYAVEIDDQRAYFLKRLRKAENRKFHVINKSIFDYKKSDFDIILALNVFHHLIKEKETYNKLIKLLNRLEFQELFFQAHDPSRDVMKGAYKNFAPKEWTDFILEHSAANKYKYIGKTGKRPIYKFY